MSSYPLLVEAAKQAPNEPHHTTHHSRANLPLGQYSLRFYSLETGLLSEVRLSAMTITASIPATSDARPQPDILGASTTFGSSVLVGVGVALGTGVGVGVATTATLTVTLAVLLP